MSTNPAAGTAVWDRAWSLVEQRSAGADALFVYAVKTTGIYCRPSCPSRRPSRSSVEFFPTSDLAEGAGYRACKRCRPSQEHPQQRLVTAACRYIENHLDETVKLEALGQAVGLSTFHTQRLFRRALGITPREYQQALRMERFRQHLASNGSVTDALYDSGFSSSSRLYEAAPGQIGMTPSESRKGGKGLTISYGIAECRIGKVIVAVTKSGVCLIAFDDLESELEDELKRRFPLAEISRDDAGLGNVLQQVVSQITEHPMTLDLALDIRATAFQQRVWRALMAIPRGETRTYAQLAADIGNPKAVRAVARACATNPVAVVIPCHRIIGSDGTLTGYRWGVERKKKLLGIERDASGARSRYIARN